MNHVCNFCLSKAYSIGKDGIVMKEIQGIKIQTFNICIIVIACLLSACLLYATTVVSARYEKLVEITEMHILLEKDANAVHEASDYLTTQVRLYAVNMEPKYMKNYFEEVNTTKRREKALKEMQEYHSATSDRTLEASLQSVVHISNDLMEWEYYSMKLISTANGYDEADIPQEIRDTVLTEEDAALAPAAMIREARTLVFGEKYQNSKTKIDNYLSLVIDGILSTTEEQLAGGVQSLSDAIDMERFLLITLLFMNFVTFTVIVLLVIKPLHKWNKCIEDQTPLTVAGAYEFRHLASVYNGIHSENELRAANEAVLQHKADHDALTGLKNRNFFNHLDSLLGNGRVPLALALMDVDHFKQINDKYGHDTGDQVLKKIASLLESNFRSRDHILRIGGDEFAGIFMEATEGYFPALERKITEINKILRNPDDGLPPTSLSVGVAFSATGYHDELYVHADRAMYEVKNHGRCGCQQYSKWMDETNGGNA